MQKPDYFVTTREDIPTDYDRKDEDAGIHWIILSGNDGNRTHRLIRLCYDLVAVFPGTAGTITWLHDHKGNLTFDCVRPSRSTVEHAAQILEALWLKYDGCDMVDWAHHSTDRRFNLSVFARFPVIQPFQTCESSGTDEVVF